MTPALTLLLAVLLDQWLGEPRRWHPLVGFGQLAQSVERWLYGPPGVSAREHRMRGLAAVTLVVVPLITATLPLVRIEYLGLGLEILLLYSTLGAKSLEQHAQAVEVALLQGHLEEARRRVGCMVSRDTASLCPTAVSRAAVESVLENGLDAVFGALFWFLVAGAPGAVAYRLINTLDAMWGYRNARYRDFGWAAARLDDVMNWIPARLTALTYTLVGESAKAWRCWHRQGPLWESPNAGPVMAAGAGALHLRLGGPACYEGQLQDRPALGEGADPSAHDIMRAIRLVRYGLIAWLVVIGIGSMGSDSNYFFTPSLALPLLGGGLG